MSEANLRLVVVDRKALRGPGMQLLDLIRRAILEPDEGC